MREQQQSLEELQHIKQMMERSSRFISLSGWSGVAAGICALVGAFIAKTQIDTWVRSYDAAETNDYSFLEINLLIIAIVTFIAAFVLAFIFTYKRSKNHGVSIWGQASKRLLTAVAIPLIAGGFYLLKEMYEGYYGLIAPGCLIFYGLALVNGSKYTLGEVKYLGYAQIILGIINCWMIGYGLYFWSIGFGIFHIFYGMMMWYKYEKKNG